MAQPKSQASQAGQGARRSHLRLKLARRVNAKSPVKAYTTRRESGRKQSARRGVEAVAASSKK